MLNDNKQLTRNQQYFLVCLFFLLDFNFLIINLRLLTNTENDNKIFYHYKVTEWCIMKIKTTLFILFLITATMLSGCRAGRNTKPDILPTGNPAILITTESGKMKYIEEDKNNKEAGTIEIIEDGESVFTSELEYLKGRGNSTWGTEKNPYNFKFSEKTAILGMKEAKKWTLLANYYDDSLLKNYAAFTLAKLMDIEFTSESVFCDLYINGDYRGNYLLCESISADKNRVNTDGFLLEFISEDEYKTADCAFVTERGQHIEIKSPSSPTDEEIEYIKRLFSAAENSLYEKNSLLTEHYFDIDSFAKMYILQEFAGNRDAGLTSLYVYVNKNESEFHCAAPWDFDRAFYEARTDEWQANNLFYAAENDDDDYSLFCESIFSLLYKNNDRFRSEATSLWNSISENGIIERLKSEITDTSEEQKKSAAENFLFYGKAENIDDAEKYFLKETDSLISYFERRKSALDAAFGEMGAVLYYDANGGFSHPQDKTIYISGEKTTVKENENKDYPVISPENKTFICWNTSRSGDGTDYFPGDEYFLCSGVNILFAKWK